MINPTKPVPTDLGGYQNVVCGTVQPDDLIVWGVGTERRFKWATSEIGDLIDGDSLTDPVDNTVYCSAVYRLIPQPGHLNVPESPGILRDGSTISADRILSGPFGMETSSFIPQDDATRKAAPMFRGLLGYFPAALFAVAQHSHESNEKHNPGQPLQWARGKSSDHADCIVRHLIDAGAPDTAGRKYHLRALAWRALALLQEECEAEGAEPGVSSVFPNT